MSRQLIFYKTKKAFTKSQITKISHDLKKHGFENVHENMYLGEENASEAHATIALQLLTYNNDWFYENVETINILMVSDILEATFISDNIKVMKEKSSQ